MEVEIHDGIEGKSRSMTARKRRTRIWAVSNLSAPNCGYVTTVENSSACRSCSLQECARPRVERRAPGAYVGEGVEGREDVVEGDAELGDVAEVGERLRGGGVGS